MWLISGTIIHDMAKILKIKYTILGKSLLSSKYIRYMSVI